MNFGEMTSEVKNRLDESDFSASLVKQWLNFAQQDISRRAEWPFLQATDATITTTASDGTYDLPSDYWKMYDVVDVTNETVLQKMKVNAFDINYPDTTDDTTSTPSYYHLWGGVLNLYPIPDGAYNIRLRYWKKLTDLSADGETTTIPTAYHELLVLYAYMRALQFNDDYDLANVVKAEYEGNLKLMRKDLLVETAGMPQISYSLHKPLSPDSGTWTNIS